MLAAEEQDRLMQLTREIDRLSEEKRAAAQTKAA